MAGGVLVRLRGDVKNENERNMIVDFDHFSSISHLACLHHCVFKNIQSQTEKCMFFFLNKAPTQPNHQNQWVTLCLRLLFRISHSIFAPNNNALTTIIRRWLLSVDVVINDDSADCLLCQNNEDENTLTQQKSAQHMYVHNDNITSISPSVQFRSVLLLSS